MPRSVLGAQVSPSRTITGSPERTNAAPLITGAQLASRLRQKRSSRYVEQLMRLDASTHVRDRTALDQLLASIAGEFPDLVIDQRPLGIVACCHLGAPYEVHTCDATGGIVEHYESHRSMPPLFERARGLAAHGAYAFIEIYADSLRAVSADGSVAVV